MAVSQKQIAEKLGVSIALVSRVLSGKAAEIGIAEETIQRVIDAAQQMGYVPSAAALALKGKSTRTLGVVVYDFKDPFFGAMVEQLQIQAHRHDYSLMLAGFLQRTPDEQDLQPLHKHALDGLIVIGTDLDARWLTTFPDLPAIRIGHGAPDEQSVRVAVDEERSAELLVRHLVQQGHKHLCYICASLPAHRLRCDAVARVAHQAGVSFDFIETDVLDSFRAGMDAAAELSSQTDALLCATDQVAMGALQVLHSRKQNIAVTGYDDIEAARQFIPAITTIRQPIADMTAAAIEAVALKSGPGKRVFAPELIVRESA